MAKVLRVFSNVEMHNSHEGLAALAKKHRVNVNKLEEGEYVLFINTAKNKMKFYAAHNVVAYYRHRRGRINMRVLPLIPEAFEASGVLDYNAAAKRIITKELKNE